jgi:quinol monooxygenase YgiN
MSDDSTSAQPGCTILGIVVAKPESRDELRRILEAMVEPTRREPGCIDYHFHCRNDDPCTFVFYENFRSVADFERHLTQPYLKPLADRSDVLLARPVEIVRLDMVSSYPTRQP